MSNKDFQNGFALGLTSGGVVEVVDTTEIDNLETLIDESGVLEDTEGSVSEKVEQLIDKVEELDVFNCIVNANQLFYGAKSFPSKAVVNLPIATTAQRAFCNWNSEPIPIVDEIIVNAHNLNSSENSACIEGLFSDNRGVKKIVLNLPDDCLYMNNTLREGRNLEEVVLNFSTKNIKQFDSTFKDSTKLKKIVGVIDFSSATGVGVMFLRTYDLEDVTFETNTLSLSLSMAQSSKLTAESVQSIIDGLATVETAQTLTLSADAKILQSQVDSANAKGWTVAGGKVVSEEEYYG